MIPVVSVRKTGEGADKIYVELYMTQEEYRAEYLGEEDIKDDIFSNGEF